MSLLPCSPSASRGALIPTQVHTPVQTMPKPTIVAQATFCVRMLCALGAKTEMPNQVRGKLPETRRLKKGKCKRCHYHLFLLLPGKSLPLAHLWSILSLPTWSKVSKMFPLASEEKQLLFRSSFECELPEVRATGLRSSLPSTSSR